MEAGAHFLKDLVIVLGVAAITTMLFQRLRQPVVLGYILAGLIIGPHLPVPLVADPHLVRTLSELGVILLMFSIGTEFHIRKIARVGLSAGLTAAIEVGLMISLGYLLGQIFGWTGVESLFLGACLGISSTMLVAQAFAEQKLKGDFTELVFAVLVFEDLIAIVLLAVLTAVASGVGLSASAFAGVAGKLGGFLVALLVVGLLVVPRFVRYVVSLRRSETLLIASMGICFGMALLAERAGYSVALGAFVGGMLVAESGKGRKVEHIIQPFRDVFSAVFFVAVGMSIDPKLVARHWLPIVVATAVVVVGKMGGVTVGAFLSGNGLRRSVRAGMSLGQIGEFSFIIAGVGMTTGATRDFLLPVAVAVSCLTALATPAMIRLSERATSSIDKRLPRRLQTFVAFYGSWIDGLRAAPRRDTLWGRLRRKTLLLLVDALFLAGIAVGGPMLAPRAGAWLASTFGLEPRVARIAFVVVALAIAGLFLRGVLRCAIRIGVTLANEVLPANLPGKLDMGNAPRRALALTLQLGIVLAVGLPLVAIVLPFSRLGGLVLLLVVAGLIAADWRSISNLQGHVRAGSQLIVEALAKQSRSSTAPIQLEEVRAMLPGIPGVVPLRLGAGSPAVGKSLAELNLRALTGASVLAITRGEQGTALPSAQEVLHEGDLLALAGTDEAVAAARAALRDPAPVRAKTARA